MPLSEEQLARLRADADTMAVEMSAKAAPPTLTEQMQDAVAPPALRRLMSGATFSGSEKLLQMLGASPLPETDIVGSISDLASSGSRMQGISGILNSGAELAGSFLGGGAVGAPVRMAAKAGLSRLLPSLATQAPRLTRAGLGMAENAAIGGVAETVQGGDAGDIAVSAGLEAAVGGAMEVPLSAIGALYNRGLRFGAPKKPKKPDLTLAHPFDRHEVSMWEGMNNGLVRLAEREGITVVPEAVRPADSFVYRQMIKLKQQAAMQPMMERVNATIEQRVQNWKTRIVDSMRDLTVHGPVAPPVETGRVLQASWSDLVDNELRGEASELYEKALAQGADTGRSLGDFSINGAGLAQQLSTVIYNHGLNDVPDAAANKVKNLVRRLLENEDGISFNEAWKEAQGIYPKRKSEWGPGEWMAKDANRIVKDFIRDEASRVHPTAEALFTIADAKWTRAHQLEDSEIGKVMRSHAEKVVDGLSRDVTMLRQVRAEMGDDFIDALAQRKVATLFHDATDEGIGELSPAKFDAALEAIGGPHGNVDSEYMTELLKTKPEVHQAITELHGLLKAYEIPRRIMRSKKEQVAAGAAGSEFAVSGVPIIMGALDRAWVALFNFATHGEIAKLSMAPRSVNPLLGGSRPALPDASALPTMVRTLRRGTAAMGAGEAVGGLFPE